MGCHFLLQRGVFPTQGSNPRLLHWQVSSLPLSTWQASAHYELLPEHHRPATKKHLSFSPWRNGPFLLPGCVGLGFPLLPPAPHVWLTSTNPPGPHVHYGTNGCLPASRIPCYITTRGSKLSASPPPPFLFIFGHRRHPGHNSQTRLQTNASCSGSSLPCTLPTALWLSYQPQSKTLVFWRPNSNGYLCNFPSDTKVCLATRQATLLARGRGEETTSAGDSRVPRPKPAFILNHGRNTARPGPLFWVGFTPYEVGANASRLPSRLGTQFCPQFQPCSQTAGAKEQWGRSSTGTAGTT